MEEAEKEKIQEYEKREKKLEDKLKFFFKDSYNAALAGIIALALVIRIYYFLLTRNQAVWWDGLCYGLIAKNLVTPIWTEAMIYVGETSIRPWLMSIFWAGLLKIGLQELAIKFFLVFIPSILTVYFTYLAAEKMYNKRVALIASFILAVSWLHVFYSMRMLTHIPGLFLSMASVYFFFRSLEGKLDFKLFTLSIFLAFLSLLTRWTYGLVGIIYIMHILLVKRNILKDRKFWLGGIIGSIPLLVFFVLNYFKYDILFPAFLRYTGSAAQKTANAYYTFGFFSHILPQPFFALFLIGIVVMVIQLALGFGLVSKVKKLSSHVFVLSLLVLNTAFLIFYIRYAEDRYMFECFLSILLITAYSIDAAYLYLKKYHKQLAFIIVIVLLAGGSYTQYTYGGPIINSKISSFYQMKQAFLWIKDNTPKDAVIFGWGHDAYSIYYSERYPIKFEEAKNGTEFDYVVVHGFVSQPQDFLGYVDSINENLTVVHAEFFDAQGQQPAVIIYKYNG